MVESLLQRGAVLVAWTAGLAVVVAAGALLALWGYGLQPAPTTSPVRLEVARGSSVSAIRRQMAAAGLAADDRRVELLARLMGVGHRLQAGEFQIPAGATPYETLRILAFGRAVLRRLTVPEGATMEEIGRLLEECGITSGTAFLALARDPAFCRRLGVPAPTLEGYLFPDTYLFGRSTPAAEVARVMVARGEAVWAELTRGETPALDRHQVLTLAAIVEKETGRPEERPLVAGVFLERLRRGMPLQADPTVAYGAGKPGTALTRADLAQDQPYNTYRRTGLPPGPIANPGRAAMTAVLHPEMGYLYFVARGDGSHRFSRTLEEHNRAVRAWRQVQRRRQR